MHAGQFTTLTEVLQHYNLPAITPLGHPELEPLGLTPDELAQLETFLRALSGSLLVRPELLARPIKRVLRTP